MSAKVMTDEEFKRQSAALASGIPIVKKTTVVINGGTGSPDTPTKVKIDVPPKTEKVKVEKPAKPKKEKKATEPKPKKALTVHRYWLIDIRRFKDEFGLKEGQEIRTTVENRTVAAIKRKVLVLDFV